MKESHKKILIVLGILIVTLSIVGVSYAFFSTLIKGNDLAGENVFKSGTMELTFTDNDDAISLPNAKPGDTDSKTFTVENTGTLDDDGYTYNIKLCELETTFQQEDLKYKLVEYTDDNFDVEKPDGIKKDGFINTEMVNEDNEMYLAINISRPEKKQKHYYKLTITFEELDIPQDYNQGAIFGGKINVDDDAKVYIPPKPFSEVIVADNTTIFADEAGNLRYAGADPNNYIWFNCDSYEGLTQETAQIKCEKWRVIGIMKNMTIIDGKEDSGNPTKQDLVKIMRANSIGSIAWSSNNSNDWSTASSQTSLNNETSGYLNPNDMGSWITENKDANYKAITTPTNNIIAKVRWNIGGVYDASSVTDYYEQERGENVYEGHAKTWDGKIGLIYPSDFLYATNGGTEKSRDECLLDYQSWDFRFARECPSSDWIPSSSYTSSLTPLVQVPYYFSTTSVGHLTYVSVDDCASTRWFPTLYLTSNVNILDDGVSDGSTNNPFILEIEQ